MMPRHNLDGHIRPVLILHAATTTGTYNVLNFILIDRHPGTLASSTLIILFYFRNVEIFKNYFFQIKKYCVKENSGYLEIFPFVEMHVSKLIN
jgi:hypothetical protein